MTDINKAWENLNTAVIISDSDFNIIFANEKAFRFMEKLEIKGLEVGKNMAACHQPETMKKLKNIYNDFADRKIKIKHLTSEGPDGTVTTVIIPFFNGDTFGGVVEMAFECSLA